MDRTSVKQVIEKVNDLIDNGKLFCPRIYKNEYGIELIHLDRFIMTKGLKFIFSESKYTISIGIDDLKFSNGEAKKIYNHTHKRLSEYLLKEKLKQREEYFRNGN